MEDISLKLDILLKLFSYHIIGIVHLWSNLVITDKQVKGLETLRTYILGAIFLC
jgi:hypothetical protein